MLKEGLSKRIDPKIDPTVVNANHQRIGDFLDDNFEQQQRIDKKFPIINRKTKKIQSFKQFSRK